MKRPALLVRFPTLRRRFASHPIVAPDGAARFPELAEDTAVADQVIGPVFAECDRAALREQNRYRRQQVVIIFGTALVSGLGGLQAVFPDQRWPGVLLVVLGLLLAFVGQVAGELKASDTFLEERVKAERLRSTFFRYLARTGRYPRAADRTSRLKRAVVQIKRGQEPQ